jgi:hypothetical protein
MIMNVNIVLQNDLTTININHFATGVYYLVYKNGNTVKNIKFVKD